MSIPLRFVLLARLDRNESEPHGQRDRYISDDDHTRHSESDGSNESDVGFMEEPEGLEETVEAMAQMESENDHRDEITDRHARDLEALDDDSINVVASVGVHEEGVLRLDEAQREMQDVIEQETKDQPTRQGAIA